MTQKDIKTNEEILTRPPTVGHAKKEKVPYTNDGKQKKKDGK